MSVRKVIDLPSRSKLDSGPSLLAVGIDFKTAPLELRERVSIGSSDCEDLLHRLTATGTISEAYLLSTCNRTEVYLQPRDREPAFRQTLEMVFGKVPEIASEERFFLLHDREAARRLLTVATGLRSMVLGEPEILGQVKRAAEVAEIAGTTGAVLKRLLRTAIQAGGRARSETEINAGAVSLAFAVIDLARHIFAGITDRSCLILGAGEIAAMTARAMVEKEARHLRFANRSDARAEQFQKEFPRAERVPFEKRYEVLAETDVVVASTGAEEPILESAELRKVMRQRPSRSLLAVDLGVPRNIDPKAAKLSNLFLHDIDSLQTLVDRNLEQRRTQIPLVEELVDDELEHFLSWYRSLAAEPLVAQLQRRAEQIRQQELSGARKRFPDDLQSDLDRLTRALVRKILHYPTIQLRNSDNSRSLDYLELARDLFQLGEDDEEKPR